MTFRYSGKATIRSQNTVHGSSVGCTSALYTDSCVFDPHIQQHSFMEIACLFVFGFYAVTRVFQSNDGGHLS